MPDPTKATHGVIQAISGEPVANAQPAVDGKNPAAVALGRLGGLKGGRARAKKLGKKKLKESARNAANARWAKLKEKDLKRKKSAKSSL